MGCHLRHFRHEFVSTKKAKTMIGCCLFVIIHAYICYIFLFCSFFYFILSFIHLNFHLKFAFMELFGHVHRVLSFTMTKCMRGCMFSLFRLGKSLNSKNVRFNLIRSTKFICVYFLINLVPYEKIK